MIDSVLAKLGMPPSASVHAAEVDGLIFWVHLLMLLLFVGWLGYYFLALVKFRKSANPRADYTGVKGHLSTYLEVGVAVVEAVLLIGLAIPIWARAVDRLPTTADKPVEVQIMGMQYKWNAHFSGADGKWGRQDIKLAGAGNPFGIDVADAGAKDDVACIQGEPFKLPVNRPIICRISSMDVIHSFKLPAMRVTQDAMPGMSIPAHFTSTKTGQYTITCAQLCGTGHSNMRGDFEVVTTEEWDKWYAEKSKAGPSTGE